MRVSKGFTSLRKSTSPNRNKFFIVGNGRWSNVYRASLDKLDLEYIDVPQPIYADADRFRQYFMNTETSDAVFIVATHPDVQSSLYESFSITKCPVLFEKPLCRTFSSLNEFESMLAARNTVTACGFFNLLNKKFRELQRLLYTKKLRIKRASLTDGSIGPVRDKDGVYFDWAPHVFACLQSLGIQIHSNDVVNCSVLRNREFRLLVEGKDLKIDAKFGVNFKRKSRCFDCLLSNGQKVVIDFTEVQNSQFREMDKVLYLLSKPRFLTHFYQGHLYSPFVKDAELLRSNAETVLQIHKSFIQ